MRDNSGVTLVELIVVMLIMATLAGSAIIGTRSLDSGNARATVTRISALLDYVHAENISKNKNYYLVIEKQGEAFVAKIQSESGGIRTDILKEKLKLKKGQITYYTQDSTAYIVDDLTTPAIVLELSFLKASGAYRSSDMDGDGNEEVVKQIVIASSGRTYTVFLVTATGKNYVK